MPSTKLSVVNYFKVSSQTIISYTPILPTPPEDDPDALNLRLVTSKLDNLEQVNLFSLSVLVNAPHSCSKNCGRSHLTHLSAYYIPGTTLRTQW